MSAEIRGVPLALLEDPIQQALRIYAARTDDRVGFTNIVQASQLELTPTKPNSARSTTDVTHLGEIAGKLYVVAFAPGDGTGDENTYRAADLNTDMQPDLPIPLTAKLVPRSKRGVHSEAHVTIASVGVEPTDDPVLFYGNLTVLGLNGNSIIRIGRVGQSNDALFGLAMGLSPEPTATLTVGYQDFEPVPAIGERVGDPHAIYNQSPTLLQVCGFLAISEAAADQHLEALRLLQAQPTHSG